ncbi:thioesterase family protein [Aeromicrobium sp. 636]|uniref:Thioesterase family protein n=1 Tax=Aeromicrobium senzhongii TaxID=2663859 RepID=A0ABX6SQJ1_9ACTN|nr:thioesterase family protein [Aeromicrobium senzhongii]MCQ3996901.1 thioesterase family protein [Aeromicrobium sp. 636]MTB86835.1 thioesterase family protein [Aeromicrobium senzhongii]QNL93326.1 thioesterase family protein [Aeromicrobium senzhongii]
MYRGYRHRGEAFGQDEPVTDHYPQDITATRADDGTLSLAVTDRWNTPLGKPNGGWVLASMLRTAMDTTDVGRPVVASITYFASPEPGTTATLTVTPVKMGRRVQTVEVDLAHGDKPLARMTASFAADHHGHSQELGTPPQLPAPDGLPDPRDLGLPTDGLFGRVEFRMPVTPGWADGKPSGDPTAELWQRLDGGTAIDWPAVALLTDTSPPPVLELGQLVSMTVQLTVHFHRLPEPGTWVASRFTTRHIADGFHEEDGELWDEQGRLVAQSRQLAILL